MGTQMLYILQVQESCIMVKPFSAIQYFSMKYPLTLLYLERPKLHTILAFLNAIGLRGRKSTIIIFYSLLHGSQLLKERISFKSRPLLEGLCPPSKAHKKSRKMFLTVKMAESHGCNSLNLVVLATKAILGCIVYDCWWFLIPVSVISCFQSG